MNKTFIAMIFVVYLLVGCELYLRGSEYVEDYQQEVDKIELADNEFAQQIIGNDYAIKRISFNIECNLPEDSYVDIYFTKGSSDLSTAEILKQDSFAASQLCTNEILTLNYEDIVLTYDRDYYIVFKIRNYTKGSLNFYINNSGNHLYIDGKASGMSLGYEAIYFSNNTSLLAIWKIVFLFTLVGLLFMLFGKLHFWRALEFATLSIAIFMYILGLFDIIKWTNMFFSILIVIFLFILAISIKLKKVSFIDIRQKDILQYAVWIIILVIFALHDKGAYVNLGDECSHWATTVKNMYLWDKMPIHENSTVIGYRYPPIYSLFQYLFIKIAGRYSVPIMHFAKHFLETALILGVLDYGPRKKNILYYATVIIIAIAGPFIFFQSFFRWYNSLMSDITLGVVFGVFLVEFIRYVIAKSRMQGYIFILSTFTLVLVKDNGMILLVSALGCLVIIYVFANKKIGNSRQYVKGIALSVVTFVVARLSWSSFVNAHISELKVNAKNQVSAMATTGLSIPRILSYLSGRGEQYQYNIIPMHFMKLIKQGDYSFLNYTCSYVVCILMMNMVLYIFFFFYKEKSDDIHNESKRYLHIILCASWIGAILCAAIYHVVYTFAMSESEALVFSSEARYLGSFLLGLLICYLGVVEIKTSECNIRCKQAITFGVIALAMLVLTGGMNQFRKVMVEREAPIPCVMAADRLRTFVRETDKIYWIGGNGAYYTAYMYYITPVRLSPNMFENENGKIYVGYTPRIQSDEVDTYELTVYDFSTKLKEYNYLYIYRYDEKFKEDYGDVFANADQIVEGGLYYINDIDGKVELDLFLTCN